MSESQNFVSAHDVARGQAAALDFGCGPAAGDIEIERTRTDGKASFLVLYPSQLACSVVSRLCRPRTSLALLASRPGTNFMARRPTALAILTGAMSPFRVKRLVLLANPPAPLAARRATRLREDSPQPRFVVGVVSFEQLFVDHSVVSHGVDGCLRISIDGILQDLVHALVAFERLSDDKLFLFGIVDFLKSSQSRCRIEDFFFSFGEGPHGPNDLISFSGRRIFGESLKGFIVLGIVIEPIFLGNDKGSEPLGSQQRDPSRLVAGTCR